MEDNSPFTMEDYQVVKKEVLCEQIPSCEIVKEQKEQSTAVDHKANPSIVDEEPSISSNSIPVDNNEPNGNTLYDFASITPDGGFKSVSDAYSIIDIPDPFYMLCFFDPEINSGSVTLHPWQRDVLLDLAHCRDSKGIN